MSLNASQVNDILVPEINLVTNEEINQIEDFEVEDIPPSDYIHRCVFKFPYEVGFIQSLFNSKNGYAMSVFWDKYCPTEGTHNRGKVIMQNKLNRSPNSLETYLGFTKTLCGLINGVKALADDGNLKYQLGVIHCPDDGIEKDIAHAHIQILDANGNAALSIEKNFRFSLISSLHEILDNSDLVSFS